MRIGLVVYGALDKRSGGFLYDRHLVDGLRARGHSVTVYGQPEGPYLRQLCRGLLPDRRIARGIRGLDILLEDELNHPSLLGTNRLIRGGRRRGFQAPKIVAIVHHLRSSEGLSWPRRLLARHAERRFHRGIDAAVYNSRTTESSVLRLLGESATRNPLPGVVAPPGTGRIHAAPATGVTGSPFPRLRILFVGNVIPRKGLLPLIRAIEALGPGERRRITLTIAGGLDVNHGYRRRVERAIRRIGSECTVRLLGRVDDDELRRLYRSHDVLAVPSFYEGYGMVYAEAQRYGLAVIAGRGGAGPEVVTEGKTGLLVNPEEPDTIRRALRRLLDDPSLVPQMGRAGRAAPQWRWEATVDAVETFLLEQC